MSKKCLNGPSADTTGLFECFFCKVSQEQQEQEQEQQQQQEQQLTNS